MTSRDILDPKNRLLLPLSIALQLIWHSNGNLRPTNLPAHVKMLGHICRSDVPLWKNGNSK
eukprot:snap_masked-scaffold_7-processed-gene-8.54-mRNA-1 protein AED:1.00 eAED:1.00 QI:0/0/0/0/1/1/2/0/60